MRVREANTRILRAKLQPYADAMPIGLQPAMPRINVAQGGKSIPEFRLRLGCGFRMTFQAETASRNRRSEWDSFSGRRLKRKVHPGIRAQTGTRFPNGSPGGKFIPESALRPGYTFRFTCRLEKPARPPSQNWVEEGQNAIAGGQYDCRR